MIINNLLCDYQFDKIYFINGNQQNKITPHHPNRPSPLQPNPRQKQPPPAVTTQLNNQIK